MHISNDTLHIAVAESSLILRSGVVAALKGLLDSKLHMVEITALHELLDCMKMHSPDILVVNPSFFTCGRADKSRETDLSVEEYQSDGEHLSREELEVRTEYGEISILNLRRVYPGVKYLALVSSLAGNSSPAIESYDGTISIFDSAAVIASTIDGLFEKDSDPIASDIVQEAAEVYRHFTAVNGANIGNPQGDIQEDVLSQRETEIVVCVVNGMTNKEIADKLFLSVHTVITHRKNISRKLQIHSVAALTIYAIANRLLNL